MQYMSKYVYVIEMLEVCLRLSLLGYAKCTHADNFYPLDPENSEGELDIGEYIFCVVYMYTSEYI